MAAGGELCIPEIRNMEIWEGGQSWWKTEKGDFGFEHVDPQGSVRPLINCQVYGSGVQNRSELEI